MAGRIRQGTWLAAAVVVAVGVLCAATAPARAQDRLAVLVAAPGLEPALIEGLLAPFEARTGLQVTRVDAMEAADVVLADGAELERLCRISALTLRQETEAPPLTVCGQTLFYRAIALRRFEPEDAPRPHALPFPGHPDAVIYDQPITQPSARGRLGRDDLGSMVTVHRLGVDLPPVDLLTGSVDALAGRHLPLATPDSPLWNLRPTLENPGIGETVLAWADRPTPRALMGPTDRRRRERFLPAPPILAPYGLAVTTASQAPDLAERLLRFAAAIEIQRELPRRARIIPAVSGAWPQMRRSVALPLEPLLRDIDQASLIDPRAWFDARQTAQPD